MRAKDGAELRELSREAWWAAFVADQIHRRLTGEEVVITAGTDGRHRVERSSHYRGDGLDFRRWILEDQAQRFADELRTALGPDYVVILESDHVHCHWSPVYHGEPS